MTKKEKVEVTNINDEKVAEKEITPKKRKSPNRKITEQQDKFCMLIAHGTEPLEAMLQVYPNRKKYNKGNQNHTYHLELHFALIQNIILLIFS